MLRIRPRIRPHAWLALAWLSVCPAMLVLSVAVSAAGPQAPSAKIADLTAVYLFNFVKFTEWPGDDATTMTMTPVVICATDADVVKTASDLLATRPAGGRVVEVVRVGLTPVPRQCGVLYTGSLNARAAAQLLSGLRDSSVLTVGDSLEFARQGGVIGVFIQGGHLRFGINVDAAARARLRLSSKLLGLAVIVKE